MMHRIRLNTMTKVRVAAVLSRLFRGLRRLAGKPPQGIFSRGGISYLLDLTEGIDFSIYLLGSFEPSTQALYRRLLEKKNAPVIIDVGANIGSHTLPLALIARRTNDVVLAFEPTIYAFEKLKSNLALNPDLSATVILKHAMLVSDHSQLTMPEIYSGWPLHSNVIGSKAHPIHGGVLHSTEGAQSLVLDDVIRDSNLDKVDLIKIDVDGNEPDVIAGAWGSIEKFSPSVIMEWAPHEFKDRPERMTQILERFLGYGYSLFLTDGLNPIETMEQLERSTPVKGSVNLLLTKDRALSSTH